MRYVFWVLAALLFLLALQMRGFEATPKLFWTDWFVIPSVLLGAFGLYWESDRKR